MDIISILVLVTVALINVVTCDDGISNSETYTENIIPDDVKKYVSSKIEDLTNTYETRIRALDDTVRKLQQKSRKQGKIVKKLEKENYKLQKSISQLEYQVRHDVNNTICASASRSNGNTKSREKGYIGRESRSSTNGRVAFYAYKSTPTPHLGEGQGIVFDHLATNIGNAFNVHNGIFVAPVTGVYVFGVTLGHYSTFVQSDNGDGNLVVNGVIVAGLFMSNDQSSQMVVVKLMIGDNVAVLNRDADEGIDGKAYSSFCGFLLYEYTIM
ncbi:cerebellin-2-like [Ruditapes philippinarum]|uniref:cerebellin-2-like n=1 Tax=Ruditapes philippinarum TaxID=129788 RepID=UPI00295BD72C|nr:cerebellin-2-like [Ruditapes philippinarum]